MSAALTLSFGETHLQPWEEKWGLLARVQGWELLSWSNRPCWRLGESNPSRRRQRHRQRHSISPSSLVPLSCIRAAPAINSRRKQGCP